MGLNKEGSQMSSSLTHILFLKNSFHTLSLTLLTLLLPLSFLLIARLTSSSSPSSIPPPFSVLLRSLVALLSLSSLLYSLSGRHLRPHIAIAWLFLCTFQVCISLGIELTIADGVKRLATTGIGRMFWIERAIFFLGLYETMLHWSRMFVRPVVDDTVYGANTDEGRVDRAAIGAAFGVLWLWMLRDGIEPLVLAAGREGLAGARLGWDAFVLWFVSYSTVVTGILRIVEVIFWMGKLVFFSLCSGDVADASICSVPGDALV